MDMDITVTRHAQQRLKERFGVSKKNTRVVQNALDRGLTHAESTGVVKNYMNNMCLKEGKKANNLIIYAEKTFVFHDKMLLTVVPLPKSLNSHVLDQNKRKKGI